MVDGFKLRMTSKELRIHCETRSQYHATRADEKTAGLPKLRESLETIKNNGITTTSVSTMNKGGYHLNTDDPIESLERDINDHRNKAILFKFFSEHLFDDDYILKEEDLARLEIIKR